MPTTATSTALETVRAYHQAWTGADIDTARRHLAEAFTPERPSKATALRPHTSPDSPGFAAWSPDLT